MPRPKQHVPVLLDEVLHYLDPKPGQSYLDVTAGYGGHAVAVLAQTSNEAGAVLIDRDINAIADLKQKFGKARIIHGDFCRASEKLLADGKNFDMILADLGVSSPQLDEQSRVFSFLGGPLDMRMNSNQRLTAEEIVNQWDEASLSEVLQKYGQEPKSRRIARLIVQNRPITTTDQLAAIIKRAWPGRSRRHPATRSFQAFRIEVNNELTQITESLPIWADLLADEGRLVVISFNSLEDRVVKGFLKEQAQDGYEARLKVLTPKPVVPSQNELAINQRARSAKLRAASKIKQKERI